MIWFIMNKFGVRGIEIYQTENQALDASISRNRLSNQGWHPVGVSVCGTK